jgi:hypothetical protein
LPIFRKTSIFYTYEETCQQEHENCALSRDTRVLFGANVASTVLRWVQTMDEETIKKQNPKCRLHWCLIKFGDTVSHVGIFDHSCELAPIYLLSDLPHPSPLTRFRTYKIATPPQAKTPVKHWEYCTGTLRGWSEHALM